MSLEAFIKTFGGFTEGYKFYDDTIELRYDPKKHIYYLLTPEGNLEPQEGVTSVCHIVDKSEVLIPWACKMMAQKLMRTIPTFADEDGGIVVPQIRVPDFEDLVLAAKTAHKDKLEEASNVGHAAHNWIEQYIKHELGLRETVPDSVEDERARKCYCAALEWMMHHNVRWICTERKIYSRKYKYAGTMDGLAYVSSCDDPSCCPHKFVDRLSVIDWKTSNSLHPEHAVQASSYRAAQKEELDLPIEDCWVIQLGKEDGKFNPWHIEKEECKENFKTFLSCLDLTRSMRRLKGSMKEQSDRIKAAEKEKKATQKAADMARRCKGADKYKGIRKPTCNGGEGCVACWSKWHERQSTKDLAKEAAKLGFTMPKEF